MSETRSPSPALAVRLRLTLGVLVLAGGLSACGSATAPAGTASSSAVSVASSTPTVSFTKGLPATVTPTDTTGQSIVGWIGPARMFLVTYGSSTCPRVPTSVSASSGNRLTITTAPTSDGPCTMDFGPTTSVVDAPQGIDDTKSVAVTVDGVASTVPPR